MIEEGRWDDMLNVLPIHKGDFFQIDSGTVHAIKTGTLILETQQSSDVTYRLYDYDRPGTPGFCIAIHAEVNALRSATRDTKGTTAYITDPPCPGCQKLLSNSGLTTAVWRSATTGTLVEWAIGAPMPAS